MQSVCAMLNKHVVGIIYFGVLPNGEVYGQMVNESALKDDGFIKRIGLTKSYWGL